MTGIIKHQIMKIETLETAGLGAALTALRLPHGKEVRSGITTNIDWDRGVWDEEEENMMCPTYYSCTEIGLDNKDLNLMTTLVNNGDEHSKVVRGIIVWTKITAPVYWWCELETYRAGHERLSSESTMHIDCKGLSGEELVKAKESIPMGHELTKIDFFSYQCLRNIVKQRHKHRLPEWHQFIDWIKTLPFAEELILTGLEYE